MSIVAKLIDAKDPDAVKLWADKVYQQLLELTGGTTTTGASAVINSVQRGTIAITGTNTSNTATVTAVDTTKAALHVVGQTNTQGSDGSNAYLVLTNSTTITATRASSGSGTSTISWELIEYE